MKPEHEGEGDWVHPRAVSDLVPTIGCTGMQPMSQTGMTDVPKQSLKPLAELAAWLTG